MFLPCLPKCISTVISITGLITIGNLIVSDSAYGFSVTFSNGGFESTTNGSPDSWSTIGDVYTIGQIDGISPVSGSNQAIITTAYIEGNYADPIGNRNDDSGLNFNQSFTNPVSADTNPNADLLQQHLGLNSDAFSIARNPAITGNPRTSKEGSGMYQDIIVTLDSGETGFTISFDWAYLTNDGSTTKGGEQDFGFWSLGEVNGGIYTTAFSGTENPNDEIEVLKSSSGSISVPVADNNYVDTFDYTTNGTESFDVDGLSAGTYTYRLGYGVVDVDGLERTSTLLVDNVVMEEVPFKFSPALGLFFFGGILGFKIVREKKQTQAQL